jgi:hypothetical protein
MSTYTSPQRERRGITARWRQCVRATFLVSSLTRGAEADNFRISANTDENSTS